MNKKKEEEMKSIKHTHHGRKKKKREINKENERRTQRKQNVFFLKFFFLNRYKNVDDTRSGTGIHIDKRRTSLFFFGRDYLLFSEGKFHFNRQELQINKQRKTNNSRR